MTQFDKVDVETNALNNHKLKVRFININVECSILGQNVRNHNPGNQTALFFNWKRFIDYFPMTTWSTQQIRNLANVWCDIGQWTNLYGFSLYVEVMLFYNCVTDYLFACFSAHKCKCWTVRLLRCTRPWVKVNTSKRKGFLELKELIK